MKGYLMQDKEWSPGEDLFIESLSPENNFGVIFEDDGEAAYFYAVERDMEGAGVQILDALHIYERGGAENDETEEMDETEEADVEEMDETENDETEESASKRRLLIVWSRDWLKCALVIDGKCHALFDFIVHGGYNINQFPPPNEIWTQGDRRLTDEMVKQLF
jgi:hypothetical protein